MRNVFGWRLVAFLSFSLSLFSYLLFFLVMRFARANAAKQSLLAQCRRCQHTINRANLLFFAKELDSRTKRKCLIQY